MSVIMSNVNKFASGVLESQREAAQQVFRSQQIEPVDHTNFFEVVAEALNNGLPFVRAQINQVLMTQTAPFNSQLLKLIKGYNTYDIEKGGAGFYITGEVNRLITVFLPYVRVHDIKIVPVEITEAEQASHQLRIRFFDTRANMADTVIYDLRLPEPTPIQPPEDEEPELLTNDAPEPTTHSSQRDVISTLILHSPNNLLDLIKSIDPKIKTAEHVKTISKILTGLFATHLPEYALVTFSVSGFPGTGRSFVVVYEDKKTEESFSVTLHESEFGPQDPSETKLPLDQQFVVEQVEDLLISTGAPVNNQLRALVNNVSENSYYESERTPIQNELNRIFDHYVPGHRVEGFEVHVGPVRSLVVYFYNAKSGESYRVQVNLPMRPVAVVDDEGPTDLSQAMKRPEDIRALGMSAFLNKEDQQASTVPQDGPDFKSDDPFFFKGTLIRDRIPTEDCDTDIESDPFRRRYFLMRKLFETLGTAQSTNFTNAEQIADVMEVLYTLGRMNNIHPMEIDEARHQKALHDGNYNLGKVWIDPTKK